MKMTVRRGGDADDSFFATKRPHSHYIIDCYLVVLHFQLQLGRRLLFAAAAAALLLLNALSRFVFDQSIAHSTHTHEIENSLLCCPLLH